MTIKVYPGAANPSHDISLSDGVETWGLRLDGGEDAIREEPLLPSTLRFTNEDSRFGGWEPGLASIEQRSWHGGRGLDIFSKDDGPDSGRYYDSQNAWTLTPGFLLPAPQWKLAECLGAAVQQLPGDVAWQALLGSERYLAAAFTVGAADLDAARASVWLRRSGSPGALTLAIYSDDGSGAPDTAIPDAGGALTVDDVPDVVSLFKSFNLSAMSGDLSAATAYHVVISGAPTDNAANHWELGVEPRAAGGHASADASTWGDLDARPYFRVAEAARVRQFHFFRLGGALYAVDERADGSPSHLYLNGDRGVATGGTAATVVDGDKAWTTDQWAGAWVRITAGTGAGQARAISANTATALTVAAWDQAPDATSEYVIYATGLWQDISPSSGDLIDGVVRSVAVADDQAHFAQGADVAILKLRFNAAGSPPAHEFDDDSNYADLLHTFHRPDTGPQIWRALLASGQVARSVPKAWATNLAFGSAVTVGDSNQVIRALFDWSESLWALKADSLWRLDDSDEAQRFNIGLESIAGEPNSAPLVHAGELHFGWGGSLLRYDGGSLLDLGPGRGLGLPPGRSGQVAALASLGAARLAAAVDAGAGVSSALIWNGAWHEVFRAPETGQALNGLHWQACPGTRPRLWLAVGGELAFMEFPLDSNSPLADEGLAYQHEAVLENASIDMQAAHLPKFIKEITLVSRGLGDGAQVNLDYQLDGEIGSAGWRSADAFYSSPLDARPVNAGQVYSIRTRLRLLTEEAGAPAVVRATVLDGFARTPLKYQWTLRVKVADLQADRRGGLDEDPSAFTAWIKAAARGARKIRMRAVWEDLDDKYVVVEPPTLMRKFSNSLLGWWGGSITISLREA